jgi:hypothetical protein
MIGPTGTQRIERMREIGRSALKRAPGRSPNGATDDLTLGCAVFLGLGRTLAVLGIADNCPLDI